MSDVVTRGRVRVEPGQKRVRGYVEGRLVFDTTHPWLVWEKPYYPVYYVPKEDVAEGALVPNGRTKRSPSRGDAELHDLQIGGRTEPDAAVTYPDSPIEQLRDLVAFRWDAIDSWFEEDQEVFVHPRDPHTRIDILPSSRRVQVVVDGITIADTTNGRFLFETGLPTRYYVPKVDVRMDLFEPTDSVTHCPYKGRAEYWDVTAGDQVHHDLAWSYRAPVHESLHIAGLVSFYNERVDLYVDGELQAKPATPFS
jgi:uncharacterized protein (DUF427 family)